MSNSALLLGIYFIAILVTTASASCLKSITCPCCSSKVNNTHCVDALPPRKQTCDRWANCQTCKTNSKICETYPPRRSGPTCRAKDKKMYSALGELDDESTLHYYIGSNNATDKYFSQVFIVYTLTFFVLNMILFLYNLLLLYS